jgi:dolichol-phosphate mannosyltransferase
MKIAIAIPTYNEKDNISKLINEIFKLGISDLEIIIVDDNSPDGTGDIIKEISQRDPRVHTIHRPKKMGLGTAYIDAFKLALEKEAEFIFEMDADLSHDPLELPRFIQEAQKHDLVIGSRYIRGYNVVNWPLHRLALSVLANKYVTLVTGMKLTDSTGGFKCFRRKVLDSLDLDSIRSNGYSFQIELNHRVHKKGFKVKEIPILFTDRQFGKSKLSRYIILEALFVVWKIRLGLLK